MAPHGSHRGSLRDTSLNLSSCNYRTNPLAAILFPAWITRAPPPGFPFCRVAQEVIYEVNGSHSTDNVNRWRSDLLLTIATPILRRVAVLQTKRSVEGARAYAFGLCLWLMPWLAASLPTRTVTRLTAWLATRTATRTATWCLARSAPSSPTTTAGAFPWSI